MNKPHKHAEVIKAWAENSDVTIQYRNIGGSAWFDIDTAGDPTWNVNWEYRVKPTPPAKVYPVTGMSYDECVAAYNNGNHSVMAIANAALRHAIDSDQVVPMADVLTLARELRPRERTARDLAIAEAVLSACQNARFTIPGFDGIDLPAIIATVKD